ncbi:serine hydroxymethyltransferase [bacterium]|nr:serine hydroxymethyltransferase [bacterium]
MVSFSHLKKEDPKLYQLIKKEIKRQKESLDLIPSEALVPLSVLEVLATPLTNKYSEGYPGARYYPGNKIIDEIEILAQKRAKKAFNLDDEWQVNVQPYSGSPANIAVYLALLNPGDVLLGPALPSGGHLTHGSPVNFSGKFYRVISYEVDPKTERFDYQKIEKLAKTFRPKIIVSGTTAYPRKIDFEKIGKIARSVGAYHLADISHIAGLIIAKKHPSPFKFADVVTTTTHKTLNGPRAAVIFSRKEISQKIDKAVFPGLQGGPHQNTIAAIALTFKIASSKKFKKIQAQIVKNAQVLAKELKKYKFHLVSGGTDNHLILIDLKNKNISGKEAEKILEEAGILANRNSVPGDKKPFSPSGIRLGTPSVTFRGLKEKEMIKIARFIYELIDKKEKPQKIRKEVLLLCKKFPLKYN